MKILLFIFLFIEVLVSQGVPPGTKIENVAHLNYRFGTTDHLITSNKVVDIVDQKIDMKMTCQESTSVIVGVSEQKRALMFRMTNLGNGSDSYTFSTILGENSDFEVLNKSIYIDNGDGVFSSTTDVEVSDVNLSADENVTLFFVSDIPDEATKFSYNGIEVHSELQGNLAYGDAKDLGDYFALVVAPKDALSDICAYELSPLGIELVKSATLSSDNLYIGSIIHYSIGLKISGTGVVQDILVSDLIPNGTQYIPNTLKFDGSEFGDFNGTAINVEIAKIEQKKESIDIKHFVTFDVKVL